MYSSFTLWVGLSRSTLQNACKAGKDPQMPKFHSFLLLSLINRFGKENSQLAKYIRVTRNWSYQKLFCMILSNFCFLCFLVWKSAFCYEKGAWCHENLLEIMKVQNAIVLVNWTWLTVLERKLPIHQKYTRNTKLVRPKVILHDFEQLLLFVLFGIKKCFLVWKSAFCYEKGAWCHENLLEIMKVSKILVHAAVPRSVCAWNVICWLASDMSIER